MSAFRTNGASDYVLLCMAAGLSGVEGVLANQVFNRPGIDSFQSALCLRYCNHLDLAKLHDFAWPAEAVPRRVAR
jgi:hypothetical protein